MDGDRGVFKYSMCLTREGYRKGKEPGDSEGVGSCRAMIL